MDKRNTRQKAIILDTLMKMKTHPTVQELYKEVLRKDSTIGQATVYRNVNKLLVDGRIRKIPTNDNIDHYDGDCSIHHHFYCLKCHKIIDLYDDSYRSFIENIENKNFVKIENVSFLFEGICRECSDEV